MTAPSVSPNTTLNMNSSAAHGAGAGGGGGGGGGGLCEICQAGSYAEGAGSSACVLCPQGAFQPHIMATSCVACPANTSTPGPGATNASQCLCAPGFAAGADGGGACGACPAGKASAHVGGACIDCAPGTYSNASASSTCTLCAPGGADGGSARSSFQPAPGQTSCVLCPSPLHHARAGATARDDCRCKAGFEGPDGARNASGRAGASASAGGAESVPAFWEYAAMCAPCRKGHAKASIAQGAWCVACGRGSFAAAEGMTSCVGCPPTTSTSRQAASSLSQCACDKGYGYTALLPAAEAEAAALLRNRSFAPHDACAPCAAGLYKDTVANTQCFRCPDHSTTTTREEAAGGSGGHVLSNVTVSNVSRGAHDVSLCLCVSGFTAATAAAAAASSDAGAGAGAALRCLACRRGTFKRSQGMQACLPCGPGTFSDQSGASHCSECAPGSYAQESGAAQCVECAQGSYAPHYRSTSCGACPPGLVTGFKGAANCTVQCAGLADARPFARKDAEISALRSSLDSLAQRFSALEEEHAPCAEILQRNVAAAP